MKKTVYWKKLNWKRANIGRARGFGRARPTNCRHGAVPPLFAVEGKTCMKIHLVTTQGLAGPTIRLFKGKKWGTDRVVHLKYGGRSVRVTVKSEWNRPDAGTKPSRLLKGTRTDAALDKQEVTTKKTVPRLWISPEIRHSLFLPTEGELFLRRSTSEWTLGPCLGLYSHVEPSTNRPFGEQSNMFLDLTRLGANIGVDVVILGPGYLRSRQGWRYDGALRRWIQTPIPHPDVILRRSGTFPAHSMSLVVKDLNFFKSEGKLHTLPRICGNKWALYQTLKSDPELSERIPYTQVADSGEEVYQLVKQRGDLYIKPISGAQGIQVYHLYVQGKRVMAAWEKRGYTTPDKGSLPDTFQTQVVTQSFLTLREFLQFWRSTKLRRCLAQETVSLLRTSANEPFDFRWLIQNCGEFRVVARVARIGQSGAVTTNIHTGARATAAETALESAGWSDVSNVMAELDRVALSVAKRLADKYGQFAEVGVDMAVRPGGKVFIFEANPTPGRRMLRSLDGDVRQMSLVCLLEYAMRATGFELESR